MNHARDNLRRAAVLIDSLDRRTADALLDQMDDTQAHRIRQAVLALDAVSREERELVMSEFLAGQKQPRTAGVRDMVPDDDGIVIDASLAARLSQDHDESAATAAPPEASPPFRLLLEADTEVIARFLDRENPQAVAVVLAHLPPQRSADVLARLAPDRQADVIRRIVHLSETPPEVLLDVEHELGSKLSEQLTNMHRREEGLVAMRRILGRGRRVATARLAQADGRRRCFAVGPTGGFADRRTATGGVAKPISHGGRPARARRPLADSSPPVTSLQAEHDPRKAAPRSRPPWLSGAAEPPARPSRVGTGPARSGAEEDDRRVPAARSEGLRDDGVTLERFGFRVVPSEVPAAAAHEEEPSAGRFDDVALLSNAALAAVFSEIDTEVAVLALTAADPKFVQRVLKQLPRRDAKSLAKQLAQPVPMRLREVERAQQEIANRAQQLELSGQIQWDRKPGRLAAVA